MGIREGSTQLWVAIGQDPRKSDGAHRDVQWLKIRGDSSHYASLEAVIKVQPLIGGDCCYGWCDRIDRIEARLLEKVVDNFGVEAQRGRSVFVGYTEAKHAGSRRWISFFKECPCTINQHNIQWKPAHKRNVRTKRDAAIICRAFRLLRDHRCKIWVPQCGTITGTIHKLLKNVAEITTASECVVCLDRKRTFALSPCGHRAYCDKCVKLLKACAICRAPVQATLRVFT